MAQLGKYQLVAEIARGGMGIVYLAVARGPARFNKLLVVKQLKPELVDDPTFLEMFLEEARLAARLNHPNVVQTYEVGVDGDKHFIVMDYLEGVTLARILKKNKGLFTLGMHLRVLCEALQGLHYSHTLADFDGTALGIVHRDATPQNLFVTYDGQVKVVDFGIAKALDSTLETSTGVLKGKPSYMAPEQIAGDADPRADVFTAGVMIWEAVAGRRMWSKQSDVEILTNIIKGEVPDLATEVPDAPPELARIVKKSLAKKRDDRYESAAALQEDLEKYLKDSNSDVSLREIGKTIGEIFENERKAIKGTIEKHLANVAAGKEEARLPSIRPPMAADGEKTPISGAKEASMPSSVTAGNTPTSQLSALGTSLAPAPSAGNKNKLIGLALAGVVFVGVAIFAVTKASKPAPEAAAPPATASSAAEPKVALAKPTTPAPTPTHEVAVKAYPKAAVVSIDGVEVSNPVTRHCDQGQSFVVHASMTGHVSQDRTLNCDKDQAIEIALTSAPAGYVPPKAKPAQQASAPAASPAPAEPPKPHFASDGTSPARPIDTSSPYSK